MQHIENDIDIVPYTRTDRVLTLIILIFVIVNCVAVVIQLIWGI